MFKILNILYKIIKHSKKSLSAFLEQLNIIDDAKITKNKINYIKIEMRLASSLFSR